MSATEKRNPAGGPGSCTNASGVVYHADHASAEPLLQRLDGVQRAGKGWRARCPACGGGSRKVSIAESGGRVLVHCFGGCEGVDVIAAVGLQWADLYPPRHWPQSPDERKQAKRAIREAGWASALGVLALEAKVVQIAAHEHLGGHPVSGDDYVRLVEAVERIDNAAGVLVEVRA